MENGGASGVFGRLGDGEFDSMDVFVTNHPHHATDKRRKPGYIRYAKAGKFLLDQRKRVLGGWDSLFLTIAMDDFGAIFPRRHRHGWGCAAKAVTTDALAARDGFEEERGAECAKTCVDGHRGLEVSHHIQADRNQVGRLGQLAKGSLVWD